MDVRMGGLGEGIVRDPGIREDEGNYLLGLGYSGHLKARMVCLEREQVKMRVERWVRAYPIGRVLTAMISNLGKRDGLVGEGSTVNASAMG